jgi:hypothetical protein
MKSSIKKVNDYPDETNFALVMSNDIDLMRKAIWRVIHSENKSMKLSHCDIMMALGLVQYELVHHQDTPI